MGDQWNPMRARGDRGGATGPRGRPRRARRSLTAVSFQAAALSFGLHAHSKVKRMQSRMQSRMKQLYLRNIIRGSVAAAAARAKTASCDCHAWLHAFHPSHLGVSLASSRCESSVHELCPGVQLPPDASVAQGPALAPTEPADVLWKSSKDLFGPVRA